MEFQEAVAKMEQVRRERESLNAFYEDLKAEMDAALGRVNALPMEQRGPREVPELLAKILNALDMERQLGGMVFELLMDTMLRLAESYDLPIPPELDR